MFVYMLTQVFHGWYFFPVILSATVPIFLASGNAAVVAGALALIALPFSAARAQKEVSLRREHRVELAEILEQRACLGDKTRGFRPDQIYDVGVLGRSISPAEHDRGRYYNYSLFGAPTAPEGSILILGPRVLDLRPSAFEPLLRRWDLSKAERCGRFLIVRD
jgi:hypothetical protein